MKRNPSSVDCASFIYSLLQLERVEQALHVMHVPMRELKVSLNHSEPASIN